MGNKDLLQISQRSETYEVEAPPPGFKYCQNCEQYFKYKDGGTTVSEVNFSHGVESWCWPCYNDHFDMCYGPGRDEFEYISAEKLNQQDKYNIHLRDLEIAVERWQAIIQKNRFASEIDVKKYPHLRMSTKSFAVQSLEAARQKLKDYQKPE